MIKEKRLTITKWIFDIVLITVLSFMYYLNKPIQSQQVVYIPKGSINQIISHLKKKNYNLTKLDSILLRFIGYPQSGWINLSTNLNTRADFLYKLTTSKAALQDITLIPGETTYFFLEQIAKNLQLNKEKLTQEFYKQSPVEEGAFVPETYKVPLGITEHDIIKSLLKSSHHKMKQVAMKIFGKYDEKKWFRYVAIASIIQKESANIHEMPLVSSVIYNRLKRNMKLQMDGTLNYGKYSHTKVTPRMIRENKTMYNTYKYRGVPKQAVCNVSFKAIKAAIFPKKSNYLYFMKNNKGFHDFACNYSTHLSNIRHATK